MRLLLAIAVVAVVVSACRGERLQGPSVTVENDSQVPLVVGVVGRQWTVPAGSTRWVAAVQGGLNGGGTVAVSVFDAGTCALLGVETLQFSEQSMDQTVVVPPRQAPISARPAVNSDAVVKASPAPTQCPDAGTGAA